MVHVHRLIISIFFELLGQKFLVFCVYIIHLDQISLEAYEAITNITEL